MRGRLSSLCFCLFVSAIGLDASAASLSQQRQYYDEAKQALAKGDAGPYRRYQSALRDYPLEPYLAYDELTHRLKSASNQEVEKFLAEHGDLPQINWMKLRWLRLLAARGDWQTFTRYYDPKMNFTELDCLHGQYLIAQGNASEGFKLAEKYWLVGKAQPTSCDGLFQAWAARGQLTEERVWERAKLAADKGEYGLVRTLSAQLPTLSGQAQRLIDVAQKPQQIANVQAFAPASESLADVVGLGLRKLARQDPEQAMGLLEVYSQRMPFTRDEKVAIARQIGLTLAKNFDPRAKVMKQTCDEVLGELGINDPQLDLAMKLEEIALNDPYFAERNLYPNVDFYSGIILKAIGIPTSMFTVIFAMARTVGWISHWQEMLSGPYKIGRPRQLYTGVTQRDIPDDRG
ncbi:MAG TPA: hypothetical protein DIC61_14980 [Pseudomonas sp.]|nr:hypothetical protein [Pseudomonas sp.]